MRVRARNFGLLSRAASLKVSRNRIALRSDHLGIVLPDQGVGDGHVLPGLEAPERQARTKLSGPFEANGSHTGQCLPYCRQVNTTFTLISPKTGAVNCR